MATSARQRKLHRRNGLGFDQTRSDAHLDQIDMICKAEAMAIAQQAAWGNLTGKGKKNFIARQIRRVGEYKRVAALLARDAQKFNLVEVS